MEEIIEVNLKKCKKLKEELIIKERDMRDLIQMAIDEEFIEALRKIKDN